MQELCTPQARLQIKPLIIFWEVCPLFKLKHPKHLSACMVEWSQLYGGAAALNCLRFAWHTRRTQKKARKYISLISFALYLLPSFNTTFLVKNCINYLLKKK